MSRDTDYDYGKINKSFNDKLERDIGNNRDSVYWLAFYSLLKNKDNENPNYRMEVVQVVV